MGKKNKKTSIINLEEISFIIILIALLALLFGPIFITYDVFNLKILSYILLVFGALSFITYFINKFKNRKFSKFEIIIYIMFILSLLSLLGSNNIQTSIFGFTSRYEGLLMLYTYYSLALLASTIKKEYMIKTIIYMIIAIGLFNVLYGILQVNKLFEVKDMWKYARGFLGNSMSFGLLMIICYFLSLGIFINNVIKNKIINILLIAIFIIGVVISGSMAAILSFIVITIIYIIIKFRNKINKKNAIIFGFIILIFILIFGYFAYKNKIFNRDINNFIHEIYLIVFKGKIDGSFGTGRIHIWKNIIKAFIKHPLFGVGIDNIPYAFNPPLIDVVSHLAVDKAHNDFLQVLVCEGIFSFITYIVLLIKVFINNFKNDDSYKKMLLLPFTAYLLCIFFGISVIRVAPLFWIIIGLLIKEDKA